MKERRAPRPVTMLPEIDYARLTREFAQHLASEQSVRREAKVSRWDAFFN